MKDRSEAIVSLGVSNQGVRAAVAASVLIARLRKWGSLLTHSGRFLVKQGTILVAFLMLLVSEL